MNILTGLLPLDDGQVIFDGRDVTGCSIRESEEMGIAFVHQELSLFNDLQAYENIFFNKELKTKTGTLKKREMIQKCREVFQKLGVDIDPTALVQTLSASEKQTLEIAKAIFFEAKLLILDEPTTALSNAEIDHLFKIMQLLFLANGAALGLILFLIRVPLLRLYQISDETRALANSFMLIQSVVLFTMYGLYLEGATPAELRAAAQAAKSASLREII